MTLCPNCDLECDDLFPCWRCGYSIEKGEVVTWEECEKETKK